MSVVELKRPRGRPRVRPQVEKAEVNIGCRVSKVFHERLKEVSLRSGRSQSQEMQRLMEFGLIFETMLSLGRNADLLDAAAVAALLEKS